MIRRRPVLLLALGAAVAGGACSSGGGRLSPPPAGYEGDFQIARYLTYLPGAAPAPFLFVDARFTGGGHYLDAGSTASYTGPSGIVIPLTRRAFGGQIFYQKDPATGDVPLTDWVADSDYEFTVSGTSVNGGVPKFTLAGTVTTPSAFSLLSPDITGGLIVISSGNLPTFTWTPGNGDYIWIILATVSSSLNVTRVDYQPPDSIGSYTLPSPILTQLALGTGSITLMRTIEHFPLTLPDGGKGDGIGGDAVTCRLVRQ